MPDVPDERGTVSAHRLPPEAPEADVIEQDLPLSEDIERPGIDAERHEPIADED